MDGDDYFRMDRSFLSGLATPFDADYSGRVDGAGYFRLDRAFLAQQALAGSFSLSPAVPAPSVAPAADEAPIPDRMPLASLFCDEPILA